jgi:hypothetical protein
MYLPQWRALTAWIFDIERWLMMRSQFRLQALICGGVSVSNICELYTDIHTHERVCESASMGIRPHAPTCTICSLRAYAPTGRAYYICMTLLAGGYPPYSMQYILQTIVCNTFLCTTCEFCLHARALCSYGQPSVCRMHLARKFIRTHGIIHGVPPSSSVTTGTVDSALLEYSMWS